MIFRTPELEKIETDVLAEIDKVRTDIKYSIRAPARWLGTVRRAVFARAVRGSNSIEGYNVTEEDAIAAAEGERPASASEETWMAITGYREAMTYVLQLANDKSFCHSEGLIKSLHFMMMQHQLKKHPGTYRPGAIYVKDDEKQVVVYEGPEADILGKLMPELVESLNKSNKTPVLIRAAMAHLNLVMIHPFSDGNGRMARCLQTLVLARDAILDPIFASIEEYLGENTRAYYEVLAKVGNGSWHPNRDARPWIRFCLKAHYQQAKTVARRIEDMARAWGELEKLLSDRKLPERCIFALADATMGYRIRNATYREAADISLNLASRDLNALVEEGLLEPQGEARGRDYTATEILRRLRERTRSTKKIDDPFDPNSSAELFPEFA